MENDNNEETKPLSKSAMKKKMKFEKMQNYWKEKKKLKKQQKKEKASEKKEITEKDGILYFTIIIIEGPSPEERIRLKELHRQKKAQWLVDLKVSPRIVIDLDFQELMRPNELSSLTQQVMYSYGFIKRAEKPLRLVLSSVKDEVKMKLEKINGFHDWLVEF